MIATVYGKTRALLTGERVALNFLSYLSAIATNTHLFVKAVRPYKVIILDTRKTTPTLRYLERLAVRVGGGENHRLNLHAMAMVKDNHLVSCTPQRSIREIVYSLKQKMRKKVILEVTTLGQFQQALTAKVDIVLLDNMTPRQIHRAVVLRDKINPYVLLEASGGITLRNVRQYARTGVNRISIGALTHSRQAVDMSLEICAS